MFCLKPFDTTISFLLWENGPSVMLQGWYFSRRYIMDW